MKKIITLLIALTFFLVRFVYAQNLSSTTTSIVDKDGLFDADETLEITLSGAMSELLKDKSKEPIEYPLELSYKDSESTEIILPVKVRARGHFRRLLGGCSHLPLRIKFPKTDTIKQTIFREQRKLKLVMPCKGEKYVIQEYLAYKLYNLITPNSFRVRLVKVTLENRETQKQEPPVYGILLEEKKQVAKRINLISIERNILPRQVERETFLTMAVFQYLIGNTDWSVEYLQNVKLLVQDSTFKLYTVPYDFDHAGIVNAPYAKPAEALLLISVKERRYRGFCLEELEQFEPVIALYLQLKPDIYRLYEDSELLDEKYKKSTRKFLDQFYDIISNPKKWRREFAYPCDPRGTGNIVIQGLKN